MNRIVSRQKRIWFWRLYSTFKCADLWKL